MLEDPESCAGVIERATGIHVERIEASREKSIIYHPEYKGVRLDVYAKDENADLDDGETTIFLSTHGKNKGEVSKEQVTFLEYVKADLEESEKDFEDDLVKAIDDDEFREKLYEEYHIDD